MAAELTDDLIAKSFKNKGAYVANVEGEGFVLMGNLPRSLTHQLTEGASTQDLFYDATAHRPGTPVHGKLELKPESVDDFKQRFPEVPFHENGNQISLADLKEHEKQRSSPRQDATGS